MKKRFFSAVFSAVMLAISSVGVTASAAETSSVVAETSPVSEVTAAITEDTLEYTEDTTENTEETAISDEKAAPDYYGDPYYDTDGNASLIKSEHIIYNTEEMQFISVTTKDGHIFYVLINYSADSGEDSVYFLNKVDSIDLYSLIYMTDEEKENGIDMENVKKAEEAAAEAFGRGKLLSDTGHTDISDIPDNSEISDEQPVSNPVNMNMMYILIGVIALAGIGAFGFIMMKKKPKNTVSTDNEEDYPDDEQDEDYDFYDNNNE